MCRGVRSSVLAGLVLALGLLRAERAPAQDACSPQIALTRQVDTPGSTTNLQGVQADALGGVYTWCQGFESGSGVDYYASWDDGDTWQVLNPCPGLPDSKGRLLALPSGRLFVVTNEFQTNVTTSCDQGRTFSTPVLLANSLSRAITIAGTDDGLAVVGHDSDAPSRFVLRVSTDHGLTWSVPRDPCVGCGLTTPRILILDGRILLFFSLPSGAVPAHVTYSDDLGVSWSAPVAVGVDLTGAWTWQGATATSDGHLQGFLGATGPPRGLFAYSSSDGGATWTPSGELLAPMANDELFDRFVAVGTSDGRVSLAWDNYHPTNPPATGLRAFFTSSADHGLPGSWQTVSEPSPDGMYVKNLQIVPGADGETLVVHHDGRPGPPTRFDRPYSAWADRSLDGGQTWLTDEVRLDAPEGSVEWMTRSVGAARSGSGRIHVGWREERDELASLPSQLQFAVLDSPPDQPRVTLAQSGASPCDASWEQRLSVVPESITWCSAPTYQWLMDDVDLAGAVGSDLIIDSSVPTGIHYFRVRLTCPEAAPCGTTSAPRAVDVHWPLLGMPPVVSPGILFIDRAGSDLHFRWEHGPGAASAFNLYAGSIASLSAVPPYDHQPFLCHVLPASMRTCCTSVTAPAPPGLSYFLLVPTSCTDEGDPGTDSLGNPIPLSPGGPPCGPP